MELTLSSSDIGATSFKNPNADKGTMIVLGNYEVAYVRGRSSSDIGKNEITCTVLGNGNQAVLKHAAKRGSFFVKKIQSKEQLYFKPGAEEGNLEFQMEKSTTDQYAFALYVADPKNMSVRFFLMPETNNAESGIMELKEGRPQDKEYYVFGSSISVKFTK